MPSPPSKIVCVGRNYALHAAELGNTVPNEPLIFLKPPSALIPSGAPVLVPPDAGRVDFEGEIGLVIGRNCRRVSENDAWSCVGAVVAANDVTARDLQRTDGQWTRAKGMDTFCPVGNPVDASSTDPSALAFDTIVNGQRRQRGRAREMAFSPQRIVSFVSHMMSLDEGDLVLTGTPDGIGPLVPGDTVTVRLSCGSSVTNPVEAGAPIAPDGTSAAPDGTSAPPPG